MFKNTFLSWVIRSSPVLVAIIFGCILVYYSLPFWCGYIVMFVALMGAIIIVKYDDS